MVSHDTCLESNIEVESRSSTSSAASDLSDAYSVDTQSALTFLTSLAAPVLEPERHPDGLGGTARDFPTHPASRLQIGLPCINISKPFLGSFHQSARRHSCAKLGEGQQTSRGVELPAAAGHATRSPPPLPVDFFALNTPAADGTWWARLRRKLRLKSQSTGERKEQVRKLFLLSAQQNISSDVCHWERGSFLIESKRNRKRKGISYSSLLIPLSEGSTVVDVSRVKSGTVYGPTTLMVSMVPVKGSKKKREQLNLEFQQSVPWLHQSMTMSKLRNLKHDLFGLLDKVPDLDPSTVAMGWTYFERLISLRVVNKTIRKQLAAACLVLAYKFNQALRGNQLPHLVHAVQSLDRKDHLRPHDIFALEFKVFASIGFNLQVSYEDIKRHLHEYFTIKGRSFQEEYGITELHFSSTSLLPVRPSEFETHATLEHREQGVPNVAVQVHY